MLVEATSREGDVGSWIKLGGTLCMVPKNLFVYTEVVNA